MPPELELIKEWLALADEDLESARELRAARKPKLRVACYLCQQAVEKALKAYLQSKEVVPPKTHSLDVLLDCCGRHDVRFAEIRRDCAWLSDYAVEARYPGFEPKPTPDRAQAAVEDAESAVRFVLDRLPDEVRQ